MNISPNYEKFFHRKQKNKNELFLKTLIDKLGFTVIPLYQGTKRPMIKWAEFRENPPPTELMWSWFKFMPESDIGIITGTPSGIMVLDIDVPKNSLNLSSYFTPITNRHSIQKHNKIPLHHLHQSVITPSGGAHIYYRWKPEYSHRLRVTPNIDIPILIKFYNQIPQILDEDMPLIPKPTTAPTIQLTDWSGDPNPPTMAHIKNCDFIQSFRQKRQNPKWNGRYPLARAYATNVVAVDDPDLSLGNTYRHTEQIYNSLSKPIRCSVIYEQFKCPHFNQETQTCRKKNGVTSPYGLAKAMTRPKL